MAIIFCGDLAIPYNTKVNYSGVQDLFVNNIAISNLEGAILLNPNEQLLFKKKDKISLYSSPNVLQCLKKLNIKYVSLCNNHILDYSIPPSRTINILKKNNIVSFGNKNHDIIQLQFNHTKIYIITFATLSNAHNLPIYSPKKVKKEIKRIKESDHSAKIIIYPHWGNDSFPYPEPLDVLLAHSLIDCGADLIVGHHSHMVSPIEKYEGKYIIYSLGNFILPQSYYAGQLLKYKSDVSEEYILEYDGTNILLHRLHFDNKENCLLLKESNINFSTSFFDNFNILKYWFFYLKKRSLLILLWCRFSNTKLGEQEQHFRQVIRISLRKLYFTIKTRKKRY